jgi:serine/threonine protein kinase
MTDTSELFHDSTTVPPGEFQAGTTTTTVLLDIDAHTRSQPQATCQVKVPRLHLEGYKILGVLGNGAMGVVFHVRHATLNHVFAVKAMRTGLTPEHRMRFAYEVEILRQLKHPGICQFIHSGFARVSNDPSVREWPYFVIEYVPGLPITRFAERHEFDARRRLKLMVKVCQAVEFAHHRGIVHRDLKPGNIMVDHSGHPKVLDFGIARIVDMQSTLIAEQNGRFIGTREYASPEQIAGRIDDLGPRSDVYALGLIAAEMLCAQRNSTKDVKWSQLGCVDLKLFPEPHCQELIHATYAVLRRALRRNPKERQESAGALASELRQVIEQWPTDSWWTRMKSRIFPGRLNAASPTTRNALSAVIRSRIQRGINANHRPRIRP